MQIVLNEYSVDNQFATYKAFEEYYRETLQYVLKVIVEKNMVVYKVQEILDRPLIDGQPLSMVFKNANKNALTKMKLYLLKILSVPYLDDELESLDNVVYECPFEREIPNCFSEAIERRCPLLSFQHEKYKDKRIKCKRNTVDITLNNIIDIKDILKSLLYIEPGEIRYIWGNYPFTKRVKLAEIDGRCYAEEALLSLGATDLAKLTFHINDLIRDKSNGVKTRFWDIINTKKSKYYEYRMSISDGREFRLFFLWEEDITFLNGFIKKSSETPTKEKEKAEKIIRKLRC